MKMKMKMYRWLVTVFLLGMLFPVRTLAAELPPLGEIVDTSEHIYSYFEMMEDIGRLGEQYPDRIQVSSVGNSLDGRMIFQIVLGNPKASKAIYVQSTIHGREWMNTWILMKSVRFYRQ